MVHIRRVASIEMQVREDFGSSETNREKIGAHAHAMVTVRAANACSERRGSPMSVALNQPSRAIKGIRSHISAGMDQILSGFG
jgi:hypothetical protein